MRVATPLAGAEESGRREWIMREAMLKSWGCGMGRVYRCLVWKRFCRVTLHKMMRRSFVVILAKPEVSVSAEEGCEKAFTKDFRVVW